MRRIRFYFLWNLIFSFFVIACTQNKKESNEITLQWKGEKAEAVNLPLSLFPNSTPDSIVKHLQVRLAKNPVTVISDEVIVNNESVLFKPLIAFTHGLQYEVVFSNKIIGQFEIPPMSTENLTEIISVHPTIDTLPENALKLYITFSKPMQEGNALKNITVIKNNTDTITSTFLDLDQELWNKERTILTLWFDPGRVKRDLQPNKRLGAPLQNGSSYKMIISKEWRDEHGLGLRSDFQKKFIAGKRDNASSNTGAWIIKPVRSNTKESLTVLLDEPLDYILLKNAIRITDDKGNIMQGNFEPTMKETVLTFTPNEAWKPGDYIMEIESRLEDLAGNNLNRPFDKDILIPDVKEQKNIYTKKFRID